MIVLRLSFSFKNNCNIDIQYNVRYRAGRGVEGEAKEGGERCHVSGLCDPSLVPRPNASAAAGGLHHRYACGDAAAAMHWVWARDKCKRSGDVIYPQQRCIGSGQETSSDHEVIAMKRLPSTQLEAIFNKANSEHLVPCEHSDITVSMETDSVGDELFNVGKHLSLS